MNRQIANRDSLITNQGYGYTCGDDFSFNVYPVLNVKTPQKLDVGTVLSSISV